MTDTTAGLRNPHREELGSVFISNYPPYSVWSRDELKHVHEALARKPEAGHPLGLYLHIPFCRKRCKFCYFKVYTNVDSAQIRRYLAGLEREVALLAEKTAIAGRPLQFVYFGGGTPSFIGVKDLRDLVTAIQRSIPWTGAREITFECEPGTITRQKLEAIRGIGVTRLSLGVESFDDGILQENGRAHLSAEIDRALPWVRAVGFDQLNIDLIAGMVGETDATWSSSVRRTVEVQPDSVTIYQMELPYNTVYSGDLVHGREVIVSAWNQRRRWHDQAIEALLRAGYEVSSAYTMVRKDKGCTFVYRDALWHGADMLGTGVASFSYVGGVHFQNETEQGPYLDRLERGELPLFRGLRTTNRQRCLRQLILQMKMGHVEAGPIQARFGIDILKEYDGLLKELEGEGMLRIERGGIVLTRKGLLQVDHFLPRFYEPEFQGARYT